MYSRSPVAQFLRETYPSMHMALYDGICSDVDIRASVPNVIDRLLLNGRNGRSEVIAEVSKYDNALARRVMKLLVALSQRGLGGILSQIREGVKQGHLDEPLDGFLLQRCESNRWEAKFESESVNDLVFAIPRWSKVIALSTTELAETRPESADLLSPAKLQNFHVYRFFNRAHGVRGRSVSFDDRRNVDFSTVMKPLLRTCQDIRKIVGGHNLVYFAPLDTLEGLRLAFYFAIVCRVASVQSIPSKAGPGWALSQVLLNLSDPTGTIPVRIDVDAFKRSLKSARDQGTSVPIEDPAQLVRSGNIVVLGAWFLGADFGYAVHLSFTDSIDLETYSAIAHLNTIRKAPIETSDRQGKGSQLGSASPNCVEVRPWIYYKEDQWSSNLFAALARNNFSPLTFAEAVNSRLDLGQFRKETKEILEFFQNNPHLSELYLSKDPQLTFQTLHTALSESKETPGETSLIPGMVADYYIPLELECLTNRVQLSRVGVLLRSKSYDPEDIFDWDNGGYQLARFWRRVRNRFGKSTVDEIDSALLFILGAKGEVSIPKEFALK